MKVNEVWSRSVSVSWRTPSSNGNSPLTGYIVQYWRLKSAPHRLHEFNASSSLNTALINNLTPGLAYEMSIVALNGVGRSEPSETVTFITGEEEPSGPPNDISIEPKGPTTVRITWRAPPRESWNGLLKGFYVGYRKDVGSAYTLKSIDARHLEPAMIEGEQYECFLRDLQKGSEYEVVVKAFNSAGSGPQSHAMLTRTLDGDFPPAQQLTMVGIKPNSIALMWAQKDSRQQAGSQILSYTLHYQKEGEPKWYEVPMPPLPTQAPSLETFTYTLGGLESGVQYRIFVTAANQYGFSDPSNIVFAKTGGGKRPLRDFHHRFPLYITDDHLFPFS